MWISRYFGRCQTPSAWSQYGYSTVTVVWQSMLRPRDSVGKFTKGKKSLFLPEIRNSVSYEYKPSVFWLRCSWGKANGKPSLRHCYWLWIQWFMLIFVCECKRPLTPCSSPEREKCLIAPLSLYACEGGFAAVSCVISCATVDLGLIPD
jgi:hypothetical protein